MSEIAEIRKLFQDLIAPDVKSIATDLAAFKTNVDHQFKALKESMETKFDALEAIEQARYLAIIAKIETIRIEFASAEANHIKRHEDLLKALDIDRRLERVEARQAAGTAA
jgi:hypothetical protein